MRVLHVGDDYAALRPCGLTLYSDALMRAQVAAGHRVAYLFSGRHYPRLARPRLKRWRYGPVRMYELIGSPNHRHWDLGTRTPKMDLDEPAGERAFEVALREARPDVVHIHEFARLPTAIIEQAKAVGAAVVMTLHDYKPLCSTGRLVRRDLRPCMQTDVGEDCARECSNAPGGPGHLIDHTLEYELARAKRAIPFAASRDYSGLAPVISPAMRLVRGRNLAPPGQAYAAPPSPEPRARAAEYQRRRDVNVRRLNMCDALVAPSARAAEVYTDLGVDGQRIVIQRLSLPHLERLRPRRGPAVETPLTFVTLGGFASPSKGSRALLAAVTELERDAGAGRYRLLVYGHVDLELAAQIASIESVALAGMYRPEDLDEMLERADLGILPSVWEEAHGFVGVEMLAKGLPVIASARGGITEYVRDGETGWLDPSGTGAGLANLMAAAIDRPEEVERVRASVRTYRADHVRPFAEHAAEVDALYGELTGAECSAAHAAAIRSPSARRSGS